MREENRKYAEEAYDIVKHASQKIGPRLPGSDGEKQYADYMGEKLRSIGIKPVKEEFEVSPRSSIGGLGYIGWLGIIFSALFYLAMGINQIWFGLAFAAVFCWIWIVFGVFLYKPWFDMFFKQEISQNVYGELTPPDGKYDYTIVLSGHTDTSWNWKHSANLYWFKKNPVLGLIAAYAKTAIAAVCFIILSAISIFMAVVYSGYYFGAMWAAQLLASQGFAIFQYILFFLPVLTAIGSSFLVMWGDPKSRNASPGAMDNATGCALSYEVIRYFKEHPEKMPKNCRIIDLNCGSEEAGLRGSMAFTREHKGEPMLENCWNLNVDSIADKEYFEVVIKDDWQFCRFDTDLEKMFKEAFEELGIESKTNGCIHNPVGGCDSTPMTRAGIKSVTFAAQNPMLAYYYHTWRDHPERFEMETVGTGFDVLLRVIEKIDQFQQVNGFNGPQKK